MTIEAELDKVQSVLHDNGTVWTRAELLRWFNDGYQEFVARGQGETRWQVMDVPGRVAYSMTYAWEDRHANGATTWRALLPTMNQRYDVSTFWEVEHLGNVTPSKTLDGFTQLWERSHSDETNRHFRFVFPKDHDRIKQILFDDQPLRAVDTRTLDASHDDWMRDSGDILFYTLGLGRLKSIELYELETEYRQGYELIGADGIPRRLSGDRTYTEAIEEPALVSNTWGYTNDGEQEALSWHDSNHAGSALPSLGRKLTRSPTSTYHPLHEWEEEHVGGETSFTNGSTVNAYSWESLFDGTAWEFPLGTIRRVVSEDRQYWGVSEESEGGAFYGKAIQWQTTVNGLAVLSVVTPRFELAEDDTPDLMPSPLTKYLRWYTLGRAYSREGEGSVSLLGQHYMDLFERGVLLFKRLSDVARRDRVLVRELDAAPPRRIPRPRLPNEYPAVR